MTRVLALVLLVSTATLAGAARAEPGMANEIYGPTVHRGETELELRGGLANGGDADGEWQLKAEAAHAFTDWWRPALVAEWEREDGATEFTAVSLENIFDFTATRNWPVHLGAYAEYEWKRDGADEIELKLLLERVRGPLGLTANLIAERDIGSGSDDEWEYGYALQAAYALNDDVSIGLQGFGDAGTQDDFGNFGDQAHYWGPYTQFEAGHVGDGEVELQIGYLFGGGQAEADGQFRLKLEYEFGEPH